jgi:hypothetical protein
VQGDSPARRGARDLRQRQAQAAPGIIGILVRALRSLQEN